MLEIVCGRLECPTVESLDTSSAELNAAVRSLQFLEGSLKSMRSSDGTAAAANGSLALANEIRAIRRELSRAQALLKAAGRFFQVCAQLMGREEASENYTMRGVAAGPVLAVDRGKVVVHG
jgi:hypothetical protein